MSSQLDWANSVVIDRASREPIGEQLAAAIEARIATGALAAGDRLPTTRDIADALSINRGTVQSAYRRLARSGLVEGRVGSGTVVVGKASSVAFDATALLSRRAAAIASEPARPDSDHSVADFSRLTPDERFFPLEEFTTTLAAAWSRRRDLWQYAPPLGLLELRTEISARLSESGISRGPEEILVTSGAQQGLDLLFRTFTDPGEAIAMESPSYSGAIALARFSGVETIPLPVGPEGLDASPLSGRRAKLVYVMPERQNPTGVTMRAGARDALLDAAGAAGALIIEDGYEEPESGEVPLAARAPERVVWLGTLSKDLVPGLRLGWIAGPSAVIERLARVKKTADFQTPLPIQAAVADFLRAGADRLARRRRRLEVETRRIAGVRALRSHLPDLPWWGGEIGSALFWLHLPVGLSGRAVAEAAAARGVGVAPGADFDPRGDDRANIRLSISRVDKRDIDRGISLLAEAVQSVRGRAAHSAPVV
ncbi:MAG: PLP-dependent aminotransferase family protein [Acidobacteria bacterium]|nr:PLP-dependent aminotransferase family protein [Acidobacteriota bacterium]